MSKKKYISNSHVSLSVLLPSGKSTRVSFAPMTGFGSTFFTEDEALQEALERHARFGSLFRIDPNYNPEVAKVKAPIEVKIDKPALEVKVSCLDDAKDYLSEKFGESRTKMRSSKAIEELAKTHNVVFVGL